MNAAPGALVIDGDLITPTALRTAVERTVVALDRDIGPGRPSLAVGVDATTGPAVIVTALAASRLGVPLFLRGHSAVVQQWPPQVGPVASPAGGELAPVVTATHRRPARPPEPGTGAVFWTSGSSGAAKAVALSRSALDYQAGATARHLGIDGDDALLLPLPLNHAYGFSVFGIWRRFGGELNVHTVLRPEAVAADVKGRRTTSLDGVPFLYTLLARAAGSDPVLRDALARLTVRGCGGAVLPAAVAAHFLDVVGAPVHDGYGLTEAGPNVALSSATHCRAGTVGTPLPGTEVRIAPDTGEVLVRGPGLMTGYLGRADATREALPGDGWLRTGDTGALDPDGYLSVLGRLKDIIIVLGENHAPATIEDVLRADESVGDAVAVGVPTQQAHGDAVFAFVEPADPGRPPSERALRTRCYRGLPPLLRPRFIQVGALPRLPGGKADRQRLRRLAATSGGQR
ncbi:class I adenylate-forming enzyme family protein [Streptomyces lunaelactis]|uniref:class I adenylate-forming enzyme family protein n=1 Tax=Streptomyces lunaelactis TaxID=1535768 RepID=UPI001584D201|nr:fatty acid--CoA ligase family protein [Streptomyces lunaelactis]NUK00702.1 long-chain fatty acid--CoA ligase [Streptomyces lunaelactis]NUK14422.1 long-chain fatty acid--CoA ligase [Streptomyces lunaelactis]